MAATASNGERSHTMQPVVSAPLHLGLFPVLDRLSSDFDKESVQTLKTAFTKVERNVPGFTQELLNGIIQKEASDEDISYTRSLLRMSRQDSDEYILQRQEEEFTRLYERTRGLKLILTRIPDEIYDRPKFLQTIKDVAGAIRDLLSAINAVFKKYCTKENKRALDFQKKEFVRCSKNFSDTLKAYFRDGSEVPVFVSANQLIHQANVILLIFKNTSPG